MMIHHMRTVTENVKVWFAQDLLRDIAIIHAKAAFDYEFCPTIGTPHHNQSKTNGSENSNFSSYVGPTVLESTFKSGQAKS